MNLKKGLIIIAIMAMLISNGNLAVSGNVLDKYIEKAYENNLVLKQKNISFKKALAGLDLAKSYFYPSIDFTGNLTSGEGGRRLDLPVGDMLNPVYYTLNKLTNTNLFPTINNVSQDYLPHENYDVKLRTSMPIINRNLNYNQEIQENQTVLKEYEVSAYKRELGKQVKIAYYNYLSCVAVEKIYVKALELASEGKRINESLYKNGAILPVYILRSESEISDVTSKLDDAKDKIAISKRYFNLLLNDKEETEITIEDENDIDNLKASFDPTSYSKREEINMLKTGIDINKTIFDMNSNFRIPKVSAFLDLGIQEDGFKYSSKSNYYLLGLIVEVPILDFGKTDSKTKQSILELENSKLELENVENGLKLSSQSAVDRFNLATNNYRTSTKRMDAAASYYSLIEKGYKQGQNTFIELLDARLQYTQAEIMKTVNKYQIYIENANCERELSK